MRSQCSNNLCRGKLFIFISFPSGFFLPYQLNGFNPQLIYKLFYLVFREGSVKVFYNIYRYILQLWQGQAFPRFAAPGVVINGNQAKFFLQISTL